MNQHPPHHPSAMPRPELKLPPVPFARPAAAAHVPEAAPAPAVAPTSVAAPAPATDGHVPMGVDARALLDSLLGPEPTAPPSMYVHEPLEVAPQALALPTLDVADEQERVVERRAGHDRRRFVRGGVERRGRGATQGFEATGTMVLERPVVEADLLPEMRATELYPAPIAEPMHDAPPAAPLEPALPYVRTQAPAAPAPAPRRTEPAPLPAPLPAPAATLPAELLPPMRLHDPSPVFGVELPTSGAPLTPWTDAAPVAQAAPATELAPELTAAPAVDPALAMPPAQAQASGAQLPVDVAEAITNPAAGWFAPEQLATMAAAAPATPAAPAAPAAPTTPQHADDLMVWSDAPGMSAEALVPSSALESSSFGSIELVAPGIGAPVTPAGVFAPSVPMGAHDASQQGASWIRRAMWVIVPALVGVGIALAINQFLG